MSHLRPIGRFRRQGFCFSHSLTTQFSFRPQRCSDAASWAEFLSTIEEPFQILVYSGYSSFMSFLTHVPSLDFIPLPGLRGVTTYHPLSVMGQFDQIQDFHIYEGTSDYRFLISPQTEAALLRVYDLWSGRVSAEFTDSCPGQTPAYQDWLCRDSETARVDHAGVLGSSREILHHDVSSDVEAPSVFPGLVPRLDIDGPSTSASASGLDPEDYFHRLGAEGGQLWSALCTAEFERDTARAERDAAILARDTALSDRDAIIAQTRSVMEAHSGTVSRAAALLDRIDMVRQQIAGGADTSDTSATLSLLLQLISDL